MPLHLLDFLGLDHHNHYHDHDVFGHHHDGSHHLHQHNDLHLRHHHEVNTEHRPSAAAFLSTTDTPPCSRTSRLTTCVDQQLPSTLLASGAGAAKLTARQAAAFLDTGLTGIASSHSSASSFLSIQKSLTEIVQTTPPAVLVPLHALSIVGALPGHIAFELGEGFLFGFKRGVALALTGKAIGSAAAFGIGRSAVTCGCLKDRLKDQMNKWPLCQKVAKGVEKGGAISVFVIRMAPVPCVVKNYSLALLTDIPFSTYIIASFAGLVPTTAAHVYAGTLAPSAVALASGTSHITRAQAVALACPVVAGVLLTAMAGYYLHKHIINEDEDDEEVQVDINWDKVELDAGDKRKYA